MNNTQNSADLSSKHTNTQNTILAKDILQGLSEKEWRQLNVGEFIHNHCYYLLYRFSNLVNQGLVEFEEMRNVFYLTVVPQMEKMMQRNAKTVKKERRHIFFFGTLKSIMNTRFIDALRENFPLESVGDDFTQSSLTPASMDFESFTDYLAFKIAEGSAYAQDGTRILHAGPQNMLDADQLAECIEEDDTCRKELVAMLEMVRADIPDKVYAVAYHYIVEKMSKVHIAEKLGLCQSSVCNALYTLQLALCQLIPEKNLSLVKAEVEALGERFHNRKQNNYGPSFQPAKRAKDFSAKVSAVA